MMKINNEESLLEDIEDNHLNKSEIIRGSCRTSISENKENKILPKAISIINDVGKNSISRIKSAGKSQILRNNSSAKSSKILPLVNNKIRNSLKSKDIP